MAEANSIEANATPEQKQCIKQGRKRADADVQSFTKWGRDGCVGGSTSYDTGGFDDPSSWL